MDLCFIAWNIAWNIFIFIFILEDTVVRTFDLHENILLQFHLPEQIFSEH